MSSGDRLLDLLSRVVDVPQPAPVYPSASHASQPSPYQAPGFYTPGGVFQTSPGRAPSTGCFSSPECSFCGSQQHIMRDCANVVLYLQEELVTRGPYGKLSLPDGRLLSPSKFPGQNIQQQVDCYWTSLLVGTSVESQSRIRSSSSRARPSSSRTRSPPESSHRRSRRRSISQTSQRRYRSDSESEDEIFERPEATRTQRLSSPSPPPRQRASSRPLESSVSASRSHRLPYQSESDSEDAVSERSSRSEKSCRRPSPSPPRHRSPVRVSEFPMQAVSPRYLSPQSSPVSPSVSTYGAYIEYYNCDDPLDGCNDSPEYCDESLWIPQRPRGPMVPIVPHPSDPSSTLSASHQSVSDISDLATPVVYEVESNDDVAIPAPEDLEEVFGDQEDEVIDVGEVLAHDNGECTFDTWLSSFPESDTEGDSKELYSAFQSDLVLDGDGSDLPAFSNMRETNPCDSEDLYQFTEPSPFTSSSVLGVATSRPRNSQYPSLSASSSSISSSLVSVYRPSTSSSSSSLMSSSPSTIGSSPSLRSVSTTSLSVSPSALSISSPSIFVPSVSSSSSFVPSVSLSSFPSSLCLPSDSLSTHDQVPVSRSVLLKLTRR